MTEGSRGEGSQKEEIMAFEHISVLLYETVAQSLCVLVLQGRLKLFLGLLHE